MPDQEEANGTREFPRPDTPNISTTLASAAAGDAVSANDFLEAINKLAEKVGGNGNGGPPKKVFLGLTGGGWTKLVAGLLVTALLTAGAWVLLVRDTLNEHGAKIDSHTASPMHQEAAKKVESLDARVTGVENAVKSINTTQQAVVEGLDELKQENLDKINEENKDLKAENKRLERERRRNR
jgi:hypothetical protein